MKNFEVFFLNDAMLRLMWKSIKILMWKFLRGGATVIPGAMFIPESRVSECQIVGEDFVNFCGLLRNNEL